MLKPLFLVRHGQSEWNRLGRIQGQADSPLTALGRDQASVIGRHLRELLADPPLRVYTSPLGRAVETADIICGHLGQRHHGVTVDERLNDFNLGVLSGTLGWERVAEAHPELARLRLQDPLRFAPPGGESGAEVVARISSFLDHLTEVDHAALVICHGVINKFIRSVRRGLCGPDIIALGESQYTVYRLDGVQETAIDLEHQQAPALSEDRS